MVDRLEIMEAQPLGEFASIDLVTLVALFEQWDLAWDYNHDLKGLFKGAATRASVKPGPFQEFYQRSLAKGIKPTMVRLTLARKIAAITLTMWKKGEDFDIQKLNSQAA